MSEEKFFEDDSLEQFLRESTSDFKMFPGRRVWHSIYNEVHPGSRWPSVAAAVIILSAILYIGVSNNNSINRSMAGEIKTMPTINEKSILATNGKNASTNNTKAPVEESLIIPQNTERYSVLINKTQAEANGSALNMEDIRSENSEATYYAEPATNALPKAAYDNQLISATTAANTALKPIEVIAPRFSQIKIDPIKYLEKVVEANNEKSLAVANKNIIANSVKPLPQNATQNNQVPSADDKEWMENFAFENKRSIGRFNKFKNNSTLTYYITPSMGFRNIMKPNKEVAAATAGAQQYMLTPNTSSSTSLNQRSALNMEMGMSVKYKATKSFAVKGGLQLNFTQYNIEAMMLDHPTQTALVVEGENGGAALSYRSSIYANTDDGRSNVTLQSKTMQLSAPIGVDMKIMGNKKLTWNAAATIQPTYVFGGKVYAISYDSKNYVQDNSFLRRVNLNVGAETYLTYELKNGAQFVAGPQVRYQLLSTYDKQFKVDERLYNIGLKVGIVKKL